MFNNKEDDYLNAVRHAQVYISEDNKSSNKKLLIFNLIFLAILSYASFSYLSNDEHIVSLPVSKQAVLGVSKTLDDLEISDERLMKILKVIEVDTLQDSMKVLMSEPSIQSKSSYTEAIARELDDKSGFKGRIRIVKQGDTLSSIAEEYYGSSIKFSKIVQANRNIYNQNTILKVGQRIKIPN